METLILLMSLAVTTPFHRIPIQYEETIETECSGIDEQGVYRAPWFQDQPTIEFEQLGCCYNDGLDEPRGC